MRREVVELIPSFLKVLYILREVSLIEPASVWCIARELRPFEQMRFRLRKRLDFWPICYQT